MKNHIIIERPEQCCACGACVNVCPLEAIKLKEDKAGFMYPVVNETLCIGCGRCEKVCVFEEKGRGANSEPEVYAAAIKDNNVLAQSSSGGIFTALAKPILDKGGVVFGAAWTDDLSVEHICVNNKADLKKLRGSKYVQSSVGNTFREVKNHLNSGEYVCFSGTPCQIAGLKAFLGSDFDNLLTVDIICHGVPNLKMLRDDLSYVSGGKVSDIRDIKFRDKSYGWGTKGSFVCGTEKRKYNAGTSPYYFYFLKGEVYRESCYNCRFPSEGRQGDITLGDYWGVRQELIDRMGGVDPDKGVSCVLVNTEKGKRWLDKISDTLSITPSDRASAEKRNKQLTSASVKLAEHNALLDGYIAEGYSVFKDGYKKHFKEHAVRTVKNMIPPKIKRMINEHLS